MKKFAFVFPGQGSQAVGMLNGFANHPIVQQTVAEASEALQVDLAKLINQGPKEDLDLTINTQPVMLTAAVASYRAWIKAGGGLPSVVAGHSLGEYSALVASGVIAFKDAVPLVRFRAKVMQEAVPFGVGGMAAILGLTDDQVRQACIESALDEVVEPVNFNAPAQVVIAGHKTAVQRACDMAKTMGAKRALILSVSAPFHSSLLQPASDKLREYLAGVTFNVPQIELINNVDVAVAHNPEKIKDALVRQAANPVRWVETINQIRHRDIAHVIECGPGKVLAGLVKRINADMVGDALYDDATLSNLLMATNVNS